MCQRELGLLTLSTRLVMVLNHLKSDPAGSVWKKTFPYTLTLNIDISTSQMTQHDTDTRIGKPTSVLFLESSGPGCSKAG